MYLLISHLRKLWYYYFKPSISRERICHILIWRHWLLLVFHVLQKGNKLTEKLLSEILEDGKIYMIPAFSRGTYFLRLAVVAERTTTDDIQYSYDVIRRCADKVLSSSVDSEADEPVVVDIDLPRKKSSVNGDNRDTVRVNGHNKWICINLITWIVLSSNSRIDRIYWQWNGATNKG